MTAALVLVAGCGDEKKASRVADPRAAVLRAGDLPRGFREGDDTVCGLAADTEGNQPRLDALFRAERPKTCIIELERVWARGGAPAAVTSAAFVFRDGGGAQRGFKARADLLEYAASVQTQETNEIQLGDEAKLVHGRGLNHPATAAVWRSKNVVAVLAVEPVDDEAALRLAALQQKRIEGRAPPARPVDPIELELDDPSLRLPVYWLGGSLDAGELAPVPAHLARPSRLGFGVCAENHCSVAEREGRDLRGLRNAAAAEAALSEARARSRGRARVSRRRGGRRRHALLLRLCRVPRRQRPV